MLATATLALPQHQLQTQHQHQSQSHSESSNSSAAADSPKLSNSPAAAARNPRAVNSVITAALAHSQPFAVVQYDQPQPQSHSQAQFHQFAIANSNDATNNNNNKHQQNMTPKHSSQSHNHNHHQTQSQKQKQIPIPAAAALPSSLNLSLIDSSSPQFPLLTFVGNGPTGPLFTINSSSSNNHSNFNSNSNSIQQLQAQRNFQQQIQLQQQQQQHWSNPSHSLSLTSHQLMNFQRQLAGLSQPTFSIGIPQFTTIQQQQPIIINNATGIQFVPQPQPQPAIRLQPDGVSLMAGAAPKKPQSKIPKKRQLVDETESSDSSSQDNKRDQFATGREFIHDPMAANSRPKRTKRHQPTFSSFSRFFHSNNHNSPKPTSSGNHSSPSHRSFVPKEILRFEIPLSLQQYGFTTKRIKFVEKFIPSHYSNEPHIAIEVRVLKEVKQFNSNNNNSNTNTNANTNTTESINDTNSADETFIVAIDFCCLLGIRRSNTAIFMRVYADSEVTKVLPESSVWQKGSSGGGSKNNAANQNKADTATTASMMNSGEIEKKNTNNESNSTSNNNNNNNDNATTSNSSESANPSTGSDPIEEWCSALVLLSNSGMMRMLSNSRRAMGKAMKNELIRWGIINESNNKTATNSTKNSSSNYSTSPTPVIPTAGSDSGSASGGSVYLNPNSSSSLDPHSPHPSNLPVRAYRLFWHAKEEAIKLDQIPYKIPKILF